MVKLLRNISFGLLGLLTVAMVAATLVEKLGGTAMAMRYVYHSPLVLALWTAMAGSAMAYIYKRRRAMSWSVVALHLSFVIILAGAAVTFFFGLQGKIHLDVSERAISTFTLDSGAERELPFAVKLTSTSVEYYPGTSSAMDYASNVEIIRPDGSLEQHRISMNNILKVDGYRFYQTSMGGNESTLSVSYDPWGIALSYGGYALLLLSILSFMISSRKHFAILARRVAAAVLFLTAFALTSNAATTPDSMPRTLQRPLATNLGKLYAYWGGRVVPLQTVARDFCMKVYGKPSYRGLTPEQVLSGWLFYYDDWKREPMVRIKGKEVEKALRVNRKYVSLTDFYGGGRYLLDGLGTADGDNRSFMAADEKVALITQICTGKGLKIFPVVHTGASGTVEWLSWVDPMADVPVEESAFIGSIMESLAREIAHGRFRNANDVLTAIRQYQSSTAGSTNLPSATRFNAERLYNRMFNLWPLAVAALALGLLLMVWPRFKWVLRFGVTVIFCFLNYLLVLQWIVGGHIPMSNGYETMQTMAWISLLFALPASFRIPVAGVLATIVAGLAMLVAAMGESNPAITPLIPVLASPLLSIHVFLVMTSYALFAMLMLNAVLAFLRRTDTAEVERLTDLSQFILYPAVFALGLGIFTGAVWANQSWGRYWGWDPKETWALITFIVYALPLHAVSFPSFRRPRVMHTYLFLAFVTVLMTYFGVNYLLSGLHSYATT